MKRAPKARNEALLRRLAALYIEGNPYLSEYAWHWEEDRWREMLACVLISVGARPDRARSAVHMLNEMGMTGPKSLAAADEASIHLMERVIERLGLPRDQASAGVVTLIQTAKTCIRYWEGMPHRFLREMALQYVELLAGHFIEAGMKSQYANMLSTLWLQNVSNAPILAAKSKTVVDFCKRHHVSPGELVDAADAAGINVAIVDELLLMASRPAENSRKAKQGKNRVTK